MLHKLTPTQIMILLTNDHEFRKTATEILARHDTAQYKEDPFFELKKLINEKFPEHLSNQKIAAIKYVRDYVLDFQAWADVFARLGYDVNPPAAYPNSGRRTLGLASAKKFIESF